MQIKKIFISLVLFLSSISIACSNIPKNNSTVKPKILCTTEMIGDAVKRVIGDEACVHVLIQGEIDPHSYQLVKGDLEKIQEAEILFCNGLNLEHGSSLKAAIHHHPKAIMLGDWIYRKNPELILKVDGELDPHIWMDVSIWVKIIEPIQKALVEKFPEQDLNIIKNARNLEAEWTNLDSTVFELIQNIHEEKRYLVTSHDAFNYFARRYLSTVEERKDGTWQKRFNAPEGLSPDGQIGPYDIKKILNYLKQHRVSVVFPESNVSIDSLKKIISVAKNEGVKVIFASDTLFGDSMCGEDVCVKSYQEMILHNANVIATYLNTYHPS